MFHLTRYKYWFFGISLAVIVPGLLALMFWGLNLGIDFTGGTAVEMRFAAPAAKISTDEVGKAFTAKGVGGKDVKVLSAASLKGAPGPSQYAYITFSRPIDENIAKAVQDKLADPKNGLEFSKVEGRYLDVTPAGGGNHTALMVVSFGKPVDANAVKDRLKDLPAVGGSNGGAVSVSGVEAGQNDQTYRVETQTPLDVNKVNTALFALQQKYGPGYVVTKDTVGASIGQQTTTYAILAVVVASLAILAYIAFAFRKVGSLGLAVRFGTCAIIALLHDAVVILGLWAIFGKLFDFKVDALFLTAVLTVIGFSVHDTIVVFDRLRENLRRRTSESFEQVTDASLIQTMARSLNTSLTVMLTLAALTLFGGVTIREFTLALLLGILSGTFSSIFNASMLLVVWETGEWKTWFRRKPKAAARASRRELAGTRA